jgi:LuxR family transcriptional regulator, maltose regulon positive regulatory protein
MPDTWTYLRGGAMLYLGVSMQASGQAAKAERLLLDQYEQHGNKADGFALRLKMALCFIYTTEGKLEEVRQTAHEMLRLAAGQPLATMQCWAHYFLGLVSYQWNDLASAEHHFAAILERRNLAIMIAIRNGVLHLALTQQIRGDAAQAWRTLELLSDLEIDMNGREENETRCMRARLLMLQGDLAGAGRWADTFSVPVPDQPLLWAANSHMTKACILIARHTTAQGENAATHRPGCLSAAGTNSTINADLESACAILDALYATAERTHNERFKIEIQAIRALALDLQGDSAAAQAALRQAVELARPGGFVRVFLDLGRPMQALLERLAQQGEAAQQLLAAFSVEAEGHIALAQASNTVRRVLPVDGASSETAVVVEPLTARERQVLALLGEPLSIKEIARRLNISTATVKRHTVNIYGKLGVNSRWDAVAKAAALRQSTTR